MYDSMCNSRNKKSNITLIYHKCMYAIVHKILNSYAVF